MKDGRKLGGSIVDDGRRQYMREYQRRVRTHQKRVELVFAEEEYVRLRQAAKAHGQKLSPFLKACINGYLERRYIVPADSKVRVLELELRRIGTNINQLARKANRDGVEVQDIEEALELVYRLEDAVTEAMRNPDEVVEEAS